MGHAAAIGQTPPQSFDPPPPEGTDDAPSRSSRLLRRLRSALTEGVGILGAVAIGLAVGALALLAGGDSPSDAVAALWDGAAGDGTALGTTANRAAPLALVALAFIVAFRAGLFNVGGEGQIYVGGAAGAAVALAIGDHGAQWWVLPVVLAAAAAAGAGLSLVAALLALKRAVPVVLSTLLLNFVAIQLVSFLVSVPWLLQEEGPAGAEGYSGVGRSLAQSDLVPLSARLPRLLASSPATLAVVLAIVAAVGVVVLFKMTRLGFQLRFLGQSPSAAARAGISTTRLTCTAMALSGALAGVAGGILVSGERYRILIGLSANYGYLGILVALLARQHAIGSLVAALFFAGLLRGGQAMEAGGTAPQAVALLVQGAVVVALAAALELARRARSVRAT